jgi:hypothetical protein
MALKQNAASRGLKNLSVTTRGLCPCLQGPLLVSNSTGEDARDAKPVGVCVLRPVPDNLYSKGGVFRKVPISRSEKEAIVQELKQKFENSKVAVFADYKGLNVGGNQAAPPPEGSRLRVQGGQKHPDQPGGQTAQSR